MGSLILVIRPVPKTSTKENFLAFSIVKAGDCIGKVFNIHVQVEGQITFIKKKAVLKNVRYSKNLPKSALEWGASIENFQKIVSLLIDCPLSFFNHCNEIKGANIEELFLNLKWFSETSQLLTTYVFGNKDTDSLPVNLIQQYMR